MNRTLSFAAFSTGLVAVAATSILILVFVHFNTTKNVETTENSETATTATSSPLVYRNTALGFELTLPDQHWIVPSPTDNDPHLHSSKECVDPTYEVLEAGGCRGLEIQNHDEDFSEGVDAYFASLQTDRWANPKKLVSLIPGAIVVKSNSIYEEGWSVDYEIFFPSAKRRFSILTDSETLEQHVLPTFKVSN